MKKDRASSIRDAMASMFDPSCASSVEYEGVGEIVRFRIGRLDLVQAFGEWGYRRRWPSDYEPDAYEIAFRTNQECRDMHAKDTMWLAGAATLALKEQWEAENDG